MDIVTSRLWRLERWWSVTRERAIMGLVWRLPRGLVYWCAVRVGAHATTGRWARDNPTMLSFMEVLKRWEAR